MKHISYSEFNDMILKQETYFINTYEDAVIRSTKNGVGTVFYVKFRGNEEFRAQRNSDVVAEGMREHTIITKQEYDNF